MARFAGLEIDRHRLCMAIFEGSPKKYSLVDFIDEEIAVAAGEERRETIRGILADVMARKENRGMEIVTAVDACNVMLREILVPYTKDETIAKTVRFEAESYLHSQSIEDVVIEYLKVAEVEASSRLLICAIRKTVLGATLELLQGAGIDPTVVELDATALATAFANTPLYSGEQNVLILEIEHDTLRMLFLEKNKIVKVRSVWSAYGIERPDRLLAAAQPAPPPGTGPDAPGQSATALPATAPIQPAASSESRSGAGRGAGVAAAPPYSGSGGSSIEDRFQAIERSLQGLDRIDDEDDDGLPPGDLPIAVISDEEYARLTSGGRSGGGGESAPDELDLMIEEPDPPTALPPVLAGSVGAGSRGGGVAAQGGGGQLAGVAATAPTRAALRGGDALERVFTEIERTFATYVLSNPIDLIVVTGRAAAGLDAVSRLAERFEVDVVPFDLGDSFSIQWEGQPEVLGRSGAVACGLGLRALGKGFTGFDLRKEEFRYERRYEKMMPSLALTAVLLASLTFLWAFHNFFEGKRLNRENEGLRAHQANMSETFFGEKPRPTQDYLGSARIRMDNLLGGRQATGPRIRQYLSPVEMMQDLVDCVTATTPRIYPRWDSFDFNPEIDQKSRSSVTLTVDVLNEAVAIEESLRRNSKLFDCTVSPRTGRDGQTVEISIDLRLKPDIIEKRGR